MTKASLEKLMWFLNRYPPPPGARIADYGGTENVGMTVVKDSLAAGGQTDYHMLDLDNGHDLRLPIKGPKFDYGICMDLLEHTTDPFLVAKNIVRSMAKGAYLFVTVPFVWELHYFPDYWRFTPQGLELVFPIRIEHMEVIRDKGSGARVNRSRIIAVFQNVKKTNFLTMNQLDKNGHAG